MVLKIWQFLSETALLLGTQCQINIGSTSHLESILIQHFVTIMKRERAMCLPLGLTLSDFVLCLLKVLAGVLNPSLATSNSSSNFRLA